jgi:hypothetical protein
MSVGAGDIVDMWTGEHTMTVQVEPEAIWQRWTRLELWNEDDTDTARGPD